MPIAMASCGQACCQDIFCRLSLSSSNWTLDGVSSPSPFGAFNGRRTCLLLWAQWNLKRESKAPGAFLTVVFQRYHVFWVLCGYLPANKSCPAPSESVSPVSPVRPNRECGRFPTRVASVSAVCGMLSLRVSMQVDGRCATDGNQDVECSSLTRWCVSFTALDPAATCDTYQVQPEHAMLTGKLDAQARWSDSVSVFPISLSPAFLVGQQVWGLKCLTDPKSCIKPWWDNTKYGKLLRYSNNTMAAMQSLSTPWCPASLRESKAYWKASKSRGGFCDHHSSRISTVQRTDSFVESHNPIRLGHQGYGGYAVPQYTMVSCQPLRAAGDSVITIVRGSQRLNVPTAWWKAKIPFLGQTALTLAVFIGHYRFDCLEPLVWVRLDLRYSS